MERASHDVIYKETTVDGRRQEDDWNFGLTNYLLPLSSELRILLAGWYLEYCKISPGLKDLPPATAGKTLSILF
jgi:hypothetical protein